MKIEDLFPEQNRYVRFLLGLYIQRKRQEKGLSISELASQMNLTPQSFKRIEAGRKKIPPSLFESLRILLSFEADELHKIRRIACVTYINAISKVLTPHFPA